MNIVTLKCSITICPYILPRRLNTLRSRQYGRHYTDDIFKWICPSKNVWVLTLKTKWKFHWSLILVGTINIIPALAQAMLWRRSGDKPLSELIMVSLLTHICIARPQWVKYTLLIMDDNKKGKHIGLRANNKERHFEALKLSRSGRRCDRVHFGRIFVNEGLYDFQVLQMFPS